MFPKDNLESWQHVHDFVSEFPEDDYWSKWKPRVRGVISELESRSLGASLRIGQSMHHIIFSTLDHHRLKDEPRVTLEFHPEEQTVRITYSCSNLHFKEPMSQETVPVSDAMSTILTYLRRLWKETKPDVEIPDRLNA